MLDGERAGCGRRIIAPVLGLMVRGDCRLRANQPASRPSIMRFLSSFDRAAGTVERWPDGEKPSVSKLTKSTHRRQHGPPGPAHRPRVPILRSPRLLSIHEVLVTLVLFWWRRFLRNSVNTKEKRVVICLKKPRIGPPSAHISVLRVSISHYYLRTWR